METNRNLDRNTNGNHMNFHFNLEESFMKLFRWRLHIFLWTLAMLCEEGKCQNSGKNSKSVVWLLFVIKIWRRFPIRHFSVNVAIFCVWYFLTKLWIRFNIFSDQIMNKIFNQAFHLHLCQMLRPFRNGHPTQVTTCTQK